jgi:hypothetical protein
LLRIQGPDGGFHTSYDLAGTCAGTLENAETTSISIIALNSTLTYSILPSLSLPRGSSMFSSHSREPRQQRSS